MTISEQIDRAEIGQKVPIKHPIFFEFVVRHSYGDTSKFTWVLNSHKWGFAFPTKGSKVLSFKTLKGAKENLKKHFEQ